MVFIRNYPSYKYAVIALLGVTISLVFFFLVNDKKIQKNKIIIDNAIANAELKIADELNKIDLVIESMSFYFENTPTVSRETFHRFTLPFKDDLNGIKALEWAPSVHESEKGAFFEDASNINIAEFREVDGKNGLIKSRPKELYYPITLINPQEHEWILGYDLYSEPNRKSAIIQSTSSKKMAFTAPIELVNDNNLPGFLAIKSVFEPNGEKVKGAVVVVYRMDQFLHNTLSKETDVLDLTINDLHADQALLYSSLATVSENTTAKATQKLNIAAADRIWKVSFYPKDSYVGFPHMTESYLILFSGLVITLLIIANVKGRDDRNKELEKKVWLRTKELEISNKQKENLLREIHHRVMNNLQITKSLMNLQKRKLQDEEAIYALSSSQDRINAIALIHQKIYQHDGADAVNLKGYLENLIHSHKNISPNVRYTIDCPEVFIDLDSAVPLAIITSEIVVNALKHAFNKTTSSVKQQLYILVTPMKHDVIDIVISDNGSGLPDKKRTGKNSGLGHDIVKKLCRQLEATYELSSSGSGTSFSLRFKQRKLEIPVFA